MKEKRRITDWAAIPGKTITNARRPDRGGGVILEFGNEFVEFKVAGFGLSAYFFPGGYDPERDVFLPFEIVIGKRILSLTVPFFAPDFRDDYSIDFWFDDGTNILLKSEDAASRVLIVKK